MNVRWGHARKLEQPASDPGLLLDRLPIDAVDLLFFQLSDCLDGAFMRETLSGLLADLDSFNRCDIVNVRFIPGRSLQVVYGLDLETPRQHYTAVQFYAKGESAAAFHKAHERARMPGAVRHLPEWEAVVWLFPEDPVLSNLAMMISKEYLQQRLGLSLPDLAAVDSVDWRILSYLPGERCAMGYRIGKQALNFVGKLHLGTVAQTQAHMQLIWETPRLFRMPKSIACDPEIGARWESYEEGVRIEDRFAQLDFIALVQQVAQALASLHALPLSDLPVQGPAQVLRRLDRRMLKRMRSVLPALVPQTEDFLCRLTECRDWASDGAAATLHGDFHTANMSLAPDELIILDWDNLSQGDPAYDLAMFGSRLYLLALHHGQRIEDVTAAVDLLPHAYNGAQSNFQVNPRTFAWYLAALIAGRQIKTAINHLAPNLDDLTARLLALANAVLLRANL